MEILGGQTFPQRSTYYLFVSEFNNEGGGYFINEIGDSFEREGGMEV